MDRIGSVCRHLPERWLNSLGQLYMIYTFPVLYERKMALPWHLSWLEKRHSGASEEEDTSLGKAVPASLSCSLPLTVADIQRLLSDMEIWGEKDFRPLRRGHGVHSALLTHAPCSLLTQSSAGGNIPMTLLWCPETTTP